MHDLVHTTQTTQTLPTTGSICTGYGGLDLAAERVLGPARHLWLAEVDPHVSELLTERFPGVPNLGDIRTVDWHQVPTVDRLTAGFPCQAVSAAGKQLVEDDPRWLWPAVLRAILVLMPATIVLENVANIVSIRRGDVLAHILDGLRAAGYDARWTVLGACAVGSCHHRHRWFLVARRALEGPPGPARRVGAKALCGAPRGGGRWLLPTPVARDWKTGDNITRDYPDGRPRSERTWTLPHVAENLPVPVELAPARIIDPAPVVRRVRIGQAAHAAPVQLGGAAAAPAPVEPPAKVLPTPTAMDAHGATVRDRTDGFVQLRDVVTLLPTPTVADSRNSRNATCGRRDPAGAHAGETLCDVVHAGKITEPPARLLPTPAASMPNDGEDLASWTARTEQVAEYSRPVSPPLGIAVRMLPTPLAADAGQGERGSTAGFGLRDVSRDLARMLPTPTATDGNSGAIVVDGVAQALRDAVRMLPTPRASDGRNGSPYQAGSGGDLMLPSAVVHLQDAYAGQWGPYADAVALWAVLSGVAPPSPVAPNKVGNLRLSPALPEWMHGLAAGWVTDLLTRVPALRALGNGVAPPQGAAGIALCLSDF
ncbi:DNA cytosine methyltransferase [Dactylosporangium sp. CS-033363]|uniref:DNA cytosine methyltransferase n=1 Tax=Dactylosporangium sp. CS-033363 TaxID=3239935 RepID=UPI003D8C246E